MHLLYRSASSLVSDYVCARKQQLHWLSPRVCASCSPPCCIPTALSLSHTNAICKVPGAPRLARPPIALVFAPPAMAAPSPSRRVGGGIGKKVRAPPKERPPPACAIDGNDTRILTLPTVSSLVDGRDRGGRARYLLTLSQGDRAHPGKASRSFELRGAVSRLVVRVYSSE